MYATSAIPPTFYGLPKIHKTRTLSDPLFPVGLHYIFWSGKGTGKHHSSPGWPVSSPPQNTQHFVQPIQKVKLEPGEVMTSYDVNVMLCWWINLKISYINNNNLYSVYTQLQYHSQEWSCNE